MSDPELDQRLSSYLDEQENGANSNKAVMDALARVDDNVLDLGQRLQRHEDRDEERHVETTGNHADLRKLMNGHGNRIGSLEVEEKTGSHKIASLQAKDERREARAAWWSEQWWKVALGVIQACMIALITWLVARAAYGH